MKLYHPGEGDYANSFLFYTDRKGVRAPMSDDNVRKMLRQYADSARASFGFVEHWAKTQKIELLKIFGKHSKNPGTITVSGLICGASDLTRTGDLLITSEMHYRLCYTSIICPIII